MRTLLAALLLLVIGAAPAGAQTWHGSDPVGDADLIVHRPEPQPCGTTTHTAQPTDAVHDVTRLGVDHTDRTVELRLALGKVAARDSGTTYSFTVRTPVRDYLVSARSRGRRPLETFLTRIPRHLGPPDECGASTFAAGGSDCPALHARADRRHDRIEVSLPRTCVGAPRWVEVAAQVFADEKVPDATYAVVLDQWGSPTATEAPPAYSPRVRHG